MNTNHDLQLRPLVKLVERLRACGWTVQQILDYEDRDRRWLESHGFDPEIHRVYRYPDDEVLLVVQGEPQIFVQVGEP